MVFGVWGGLPRVWGGLAGPAMEVRRVHVDVSVVLGGLGWGGRCRVVLWVRGWPLGVTRARGGVVLRWVVFCGALVVSWTPADGDGGRVWGAEQVSGLLRHARHGNGRDAACVPWRSGRRVARCVSTGGVCGVPCWPLLCGLLLAGGALLPPLAPSHV